MHLALLLLQQNPIDPEQAKRIFMTFLAIMPVIILIGYIIFIVPFWFICKKAGFSPWLSLINVIPLGNIILIYVLAFAEWKVGPMVAQRMPGYTLIRRRRRRRSRLREHAVPSLRPNVLASKRNHLVVD